MFNYLGVITEHIAAENNPKNYDRYKVRVYVISDSEDIEASVLTIPGIHTEYKIGDSVVIAELENNEVDYIILGVIQPKVADTSRTLQTISIKQAVIKSGQIENDVVIVDDTERNSDFLSDFKPQQLSSVLNDVANLKTTFQTFDFIKNST